MSSPKLSRRTLRVAVDVGARIRALRERTPNLSQETLAKKIGMTRQNYARIEYGLTNVTLDTLIRIADGLGVECNVRFSRPKG